MANCRKDCIHYPVCDLAYRKTVIDFDTMLEEYRVDLDDMEKHCKYFLPHPQKKVVYWISCSTGCSCCSDQNFDYGFFLDKNEAEARANKWRNGDGNPLASQYVSGWVVYQAKFKSLFLPRLCACNLFSKLLVRPTY